MRSFLLEQLSRLILPLAILLAIHLYWRGHNLPGGGFVGGLTLAVAGILIVAAYGLKVFRDRVPVDPAWMTVFGFVFIMVATLLPLLFGQPMLTHQQGHIDVFGVLPYHFHTAAIYDLGVMLVVGTGGTSAAIHLWELSHSTHDHNDGGNPADGEQQ